MEIKTKLENAISSLKEKRPVIHQITNYVSANDCANLTLAIGALPVMADAANEVSEITCLSKALVLNLGTLNERRLESMLKAGSAAREFGIPIVLDPTGAGASEFRTASASMLVKELKPAIIRGNLSEIMALNGMKPLSFGVDTAEVLENSDDGVQQVMNLTTDLAKKLGTVVAVTGSIDVINDGKYSCSIRNGSGWMTKVTGMGCMCSAAVGAFAAVRNNPYEAAILGVLMIGVAGEAAAKWLEQQAEKDMELGIGSYRIRFFDEVSTMTDHKLLKLAKLEEKHGK